MIKYLFLVIAVLTSFWIFTLINRSQTSPNLPENHPVTQISPIPHISLTPPPSQKTLSTTYHIFQSFNNCGPAALSMALSYYGFNVSQEILGQQLRPYQVPGGNNDDKSVTLKELAEKSKEYNLIPYHRPNGNIDQIKLFITYDMPVITHTWLKENEDIGHYRIVKGYDETTKQLIQDDSLQGKNLSYTYDEFNAIWKKFNYEYLVLVPKDKQKIAETLLKEDVDEKKAWEKAAKNAQSEVNKNPDDIYARFNLSVAFYHTGDYQSSVTEFEKMENQLPLRTLWYQIEPIQSYYELANYERVLSITEKILNNQNRAFSELYIIRGDVFKKQGKIAEAKSEYKKAVLYNINLKLAQEALQSI